jgi:hypothetical protein
VARIIAHCRARSSDTEKRDHENSSHPDARFAALPDLHSSRATSGCAIRNWVYYACIMWMRGRSAELELRMAP